MTTQQSSILLGAGCFWCVEAVFSGLRGIISAEPGYAGGSVDNPSYEAVCTGRTGHAEVVKVVFDPAEIGLEDVLRVFSRRMIPPSSTGRATMSARSTAPSFSGCHPAGNSPQGAGRN